MSPEEHLNKIVAKCRELLAIAEKRTPGNMTARQAVDGGILQCHFFVRAPGCVSFAPFAICQSATMHTDQARDNAAFIASCAGPAEAGWRATIKTIERYQRSTRFSQVSEDIIEEVRAAWPEELL